MTKSEYINELLKNSPKPSMREIQEGFVLVDKLFEWLEKKRRKQKGQTFSSFRILKIFKKERK